MAVPVSSSPDVGEETNLEEVVLELRSQLVESQQDFRDLKEQFLMCKSTVYSLANQLQKYECIKDSDLLVSALGEMMLSNEGELAEKLTLEEQLRESNIIIDHQSQELSELRDRLRHGRNVSSLISEHLCELLTLHGCDSHKLHELLVLVYKLTDCLILKLSPENHDNQDGSEQDSLNSSPKSERQQKAEYPFLPGEKYFPSSGGGHPDSSGSSGRLTSSPLSSHETKASSVLDGAKNHDNQDGSKQDSLNSSPKSERQQKAEYPFLPGEKYFPSPGGGHPDSSGSSGRLTTSLLGAHETKASSVLDGAKNHDNKDGSKQDSLNSSPKSERLQKAEYPFLPGEKYFPSPGGGHPESSGSPGSLTTSLLGSHETKASSVLDGAKNHDNQDGSKQDSLNSSPKSEGQQKAEYPFLPGEKYFPSSGGGHPDSSGSSGRLTTSLLGSHETKASSVLDGGKNHDNEDDEGQDALHSSDDVD